MELETRHAEPSDTLEIHDILTSPHVLEGSMRLKFMPRALTEERLSARPGRYQIVAVAEGQVAGFLELVGHPENPRWAHSAEINLIATRADMRGKGVARLLLSEIVIFADCALGLERLDLKVWANNDVAIRLYEQFGFEKEGLLRRYARAPDGFHDAVAMGRLRASDDAD